MLDDARNEALGMQGVRFTIHADVFDLDPRMARNEATDAGDAEATLVGRLNTFRPSDDLGVEHNSGLHLRRIGVALVRPRSHNNNTLHDSDLRCCNAGAFVLETCVQKVTSIAQIHHCKRRADAHSWLSETAVAEL